MARPIPATTLQLKAEAIITSTEAYGTIVTMTLFRPDADTLAKIITLSKGDVFSVVKSATGIGDNDHAHYQVKKHEFLKCINVDCSDAQTLIFFVG